ncbi:HRDC domain-containing protein [Planctomycetota bacterium]
MLVATGLRRVEWDSESASGGLRALAEREEPTLEWLQRQRDDRALKARLGLDESLTRTLLSGVSEAWSTLGRSPTRTDVARLLRGQSYVNVAAARTPLETGLRGVFYGVSAVDIRMCLDHLVAVGLLEWDRAGSRRLVLTLEGLEYLEGRGDTRVTGVSRVLFRTPVCGPLFDDLRAFRAGQAVERDVPAYRILTNRALENIAAAKPLSLAELAELPSVGPATLADFGPDILRVVRSCAGE